MFKLFSKPENRTALKAAAEAALTRTMLHYPDHRATPRQKEQYKRSVALGRHTVTFLSR